MENAIVVKEFYDGVVPDEKSRSVLRHVGHSRLLPTTGIVPWFIDPLHRPGYGQERHKGTEGSFPASGMGP